MTTANCLYITLELDAGADPIRGSVEHADGSRRSFWGWLELMDELRAVAASQPTRPRQPTPERITPSAPADARATRRKPPPAREEQP
jgi:hypothetical protein